VTQVEVWVEGRDFVGGSVRSARGFIWSPHPVFHCAES
ncbi:uncharacterized protein METZ01_LOCUS187931, partial [marine metagenome]